MATSPQANRKYILDFDGTITKSDTISTLFSLALTTDPSQHKSQAHGAILSGYAQDYSAHAAAYEPQSRDTLASELAFLRSLAPVEQRSFARVSASRILAGVDFSLAAGAAVTVIGDGDGEVAATNGAREVRVEIRKGFTAVLRELEDRQSPWAVLSVNFSRDFIAGIIRHALGRDTAGGFKIISNSVDFQTGAISGPGGKRVLATCQDKRHYLQELREEWREETEELVYVGDSATDLECLMDADVGIVIVNEGDEEGSGLLKTLRRIGLTAVHVSEFRGRDDANKKVLFWARDFEEIIAGGVVTLR
ncbi:hypothetical protein PVAG01_04002 [Phlyctema vagabunda]|uniref:Haloacid dehalogenase-like hydrolase n=1 Tax=Phlyctema vagabunda TaxID=108571 RepID=A0ABR4PN28_9HELO